MTKQKGISRRGAIKSSVLGLIAVSIPSIVYSKDFLNTNSTNFYKGDLSLNYPSIDYDVALEVVSTSHFDLDRVKTLVNKRPELARATWDWAFGDWETALGAASHTGRRDIAHFLMSKGARPDIFTFAMLGNYAAVKAIIEGTPGVESITGPHGINLLEHANAGLISDDITKSQKKASSKLISYLKKLDTANPKATNLEMTTEEKEKYVGDYMYGDTPNAGLSVKLSRNKTLKLGRLGEFGGLLYNKAPNVFTYRGTTSVEIIFSVVDESVKSLTIIEPDLKLKALKV